MKRLFLIGAVVCFLAMAPSWAPCADPPHDATNNISCSSCHMMHKSLGSGLTSADSNVNLCQNCHNPAGQASGKPLTDSMQAEPGLLGTSHSWNGPIINAAYGADVPQNPGLVLRIEGVITGMATQDSAPSTTTLTDANASYPAGSLFNDVIMFYYNSPASGSGANLRQQRTITANGATTITWSPGMPVPPEQYDRYVVVDSGARLSCSVCHSQHSQKLSPWDPISNTTYTSGVTDDRRMMRINNEYNELCEDCHRSRVMAYGDAHNEALADGTNVFSHPVGNILNFAGYDNPEPLDANGAPQTNSPSMPNRYAGDADGDPTNNIVLDKDGKVRCLSCHRIHYVESVR